VSTDGGEQTVGGNVAPICGCKGEGSGGGEAENLCRYSLSFRAIQKEVREGGFRIYRGDEPRDCHRGGPKKGIGSGYQGGSALAFPTWGGGARGGASWGLTVWVGGKDVGGASDSGGKKGIDRLASGCTTLKFPSQTVRRGAF